MVVKVDKAANGILLGLCDLALKKGGIENIETVSSILNAIEIVEDPKQEKKEVKK